VTPAQRNLISLRVTSDRYSAYLVALDLWRGDYESAGEVIDSFRNDNTGTVTWKTERKLLKFLELVGAALQHGSQFEPTDNRRRLIDAHDAAWLVAVKKCVRHGRVSVVDLKPPPLQEWKSQFRRLFPKVRLPKNRTFERAAKELGLLYSAPIGRPRGSRNQIRRKRHR
jgi:hypothetical protein